MVKPELLDRQWAECTSCEFERLDCINEALGRDVHSSIVPSPEKIDIVRNAAGSVDDERRKCTRLATAARTLGLPRFP